MPAESITYAYENGTTLELRPYEDGLRLFRAKITTAEFEIPSTIEGLPVVSLTHRALSSNDTLRSLTIPATIYHMDIRAFERCTNLERIVFADDMVTFDRLWLKGCQSLRSLTLPGNVKVLDEALLSGLDLEELIIGSKTRSVAGTPFTRCNITRIAVHPDNEFLDTDGMGLISKRDGVFVSLATNVDSYRVPDGCTAIGHKAFSFNTRLKEVLIPEGVVALAPFAFSNSAVERVTLPGTLTKIGVKSFYRCLHLKSLELPASVRRIDSEAFSGSSLEKLTLPESITYLGRGVFSKTKLVSSGTTPTLAFSGETERYYIDDQGVLYRRLDDGFALLEVIDEQAKCIVVADGTRYIDAESFQRHDCIEEVVLPDTVTHIGDDAFRGCSNLTKVKPSNSLVWIGDRAFFETAIESFALPATFEHLGDCALVTCNGVYTMHPPTLKELIVDDRCLRFWMEQGMLCERLDDGSVRIDLFVGPRSEIAIDEHITSVAHYAFAGCTGIESVRLHDRIKSVGFMGLAIADVLSHVTLELSEPVDGVDEVALEFVTPEVGKNPLHDFMRKGVMKPQALYAAYDTAIMHMHTSFDRTRRIVDRLANPILLDNGDRDNYEHMVSIMLDRAIEEFAQHDYALGFDQLADIGLLDANGISKAIEYATEAGAVMTSGHLLQLQRERFSEGRFDFDL